MEKFKKQSGEAALKENPPNHFETEVANYVQIGLMKRYLGKKLGENYATSEKKGEYEKKWVEKYQYIFRIIFDENKEEFLGAYKEDKDALIAAVEEALSDPL